MEGVSDGRSYGLGVPLAVLAKAMRKVDYPGMDPGHLFA